MLKNNEKNSINEDLVRHIGMLSRIDIDDKDLARFKKQLTRILEYINQLSEVDTENIPPTSHAVSSMKNVFREDVKKGSIPLEDALGNAPAREGRFFSVPKIIK